MSSEDTLLPIREVVLVCPVCTREKRVHLDPPLESVQAFIDWTKTLARWHDCPATTCDIKIPVHRPA